MAVQNGKVPIAALTRIPAEFYTHGDVTYLAREAAASFLRLATAFRARFGKRLVGVSFYRPYARQVEIFTQNYRPVSRTRSKPSDRTFRGQTWEKYRGANVASPGYSNHGLGLAVDIHSGVQTIGSPEHDWMLTTGDDYGWSWDEGRRNGEGWHFRYVAAQDHHKGQTPAQTAATAAAAVAKTVAQLEEEELMAAIDEIRALRADIATVHNSVLGTKADVATVHNSVNDTPRRVLTYPVQRAGGQTGTTNLAATLAWSDAHVVGTRQAVADAAKGLGLDAAQVAKIADAAAAAVRQVNAADIAAQLTVQAKQ